MSNYYKIKRNNITNGDGIRTAIFFCGCDFHCDGCFNAELWNPDAGFKFSDDTYDYIKDSMSEHIAGISILGGEPLSSYNYDTVLDLCMHFKQDFSNKNIWLWTGYTLDTITDKRILDYIDVLVDGKFDKSLWDPELAYRGSSNQRILKRGEEF